MKSLYLIFLSIAISLTTLGQAQNFEGKIQFAIEQIANDSTVNITMLVNNFGTGFTSYVKNGNYKQIFIKASKVEWVIYQNEVNRYYYKAPGIDTVYFYDCSKDWNHTLTVTKLDEADTILGYPCKLLLLEHPDFKYLVFYAPSLPLKPDYFAQCKFGDYNLITENTRSVYLRLVFATREATEIYMAQKVEHLKISDSMFTLPKLPLKQMN